MPRLLYTVDYAAAPLDLAAQAIAILRLQGFAQRIGLLTPTQEITGPPALHTRLEERFSTLTWVDGDE